MCKSVSHNPILYSYCSLHLHIGPRSIDDEADAYLDAPPKICAFCKRGRDDELRCVYQIEAIMATNNSEIFQSLRICTAHGKNFWVEYQSYVHYISRYIFLSPLSHLSFDANCFSLI